jgi:hypothetical protein
MLSFWTDTAIPDSSLGLSTRVFPEFAREGSSSTFQEPEPPDDLAHICKTNTRAFNNALQSASPGDTVLVPDTTSFHFTGGIKGVDLSHITLDIAGSMNFVHDQEVHIHATGECLIGSWTVSLAHLFSFVICTH